jgi:hypothetical protein
MSKELKRQILVILGMEGAMNDDLRGERLQLMLTGDELKALDNFRFDRRMPSRAAAVRELLKRGLSAEGFKIADGDTKSSDFGVLAQGSGKGGDGAEPAE